MTSHLSPSCLHHFRQFVQSTAVIDEMINKWRQKAYYVFVDKQFETKSRSLGILDSRR